MPNWCNNVLTISGPKESIEALKKAAYNATDDSLFALGKLYPMPACLNVEHSPATDVAENNIAETGFPSWYEWCNEKWGTKWDVVDTKELDAEPGNWKILFYTAWSPPLRAIQKISMDFPNLEFNIEYSEYMAGISGMTVFSNGKCFLHESDDDLHKCISCKDELVKIKIRLLELPVMYRCWATFGGFGSYSDLKVELYYFGSRAGRNSILPYEQLIENHNELHNIFCDEEIAMFESVIDENFFLDELTELEAYLKRHYNCTLEYSKVDFPSKYSSPGYSHKYLNDEIEAPTLKKLDTSYPLDFNVLYSHADPDDDEDIPF